MPSYLSNKTPVALTEGVSKDDLRKLAQAFLRDVPGIPSKPPISLICSFMTLDGLKSVVSTGVLDCAVYDELTKKATTYLAKKADGKTASKAAYPESVPAKDDMTAYRNRANLSDEDFKTGKESCAKCTGARWDTKNHVWYVIPFTGKTKPTPTPKQVTPEPANTPNAAPVQPPALDNAPEAPTTPVQTPSDDLTTADPFNADNFAQMESQAIKDLFQSAQDRDRKPTRPLAPDANSEEYNATNDADGMKFLAASNDYTKQIQTFSANLHQWQGRFETRKRNVASALDTATKAQRAALTGAGKANALTDFQSRVQAHWNQETNKPLFAICDHPKVNPLFSVSTTVQELLDAVLASGMREQDTAINAALWGPAGAGKTETARHFAAVHNLPFIKLDGALVKESRQVFGYVRIKDGTSEFVPSRFIRGYQAGYCVLLVDEQTRIPGPLQGSLLPLFDAAGGVYIDELDITVQRGPCVFVFAASNVGAGFNVFQGDVALTNRFGIHIRAEYMKPAAEAKLLVSLGATSKDAGNLVSAANATRELFLRNELSQPVTTRTTIAAARLLGLNVSVNTVAESISSEYVKSDEERTAVKALFDAVMGK
jgi:MoxR-like ATPase